MAAPGERAQGGSGRSTGGSYTVENAVPRYFTARHRRGSRGLSSDRSYTEARILPELGSIELSRLTTSRIRHWHTDLATLPKFVRTKAGATSRAVKTVDPDDPEAVRARRSSANRILTVLKAALNYAFQEGLVSSDQAWRRVKPFREADAPRVQFLREREIGELLRASRPDEFRYLASGALATGCRYGELIRLRVNDFNSSSQRVTVTRSKTGKPRHVVLNNGEGMELFARLTMGRKSNELIFLRSNGTPWKASDQLRLMAGGVRAEPASTRRSASTSFVIHTLRCWRNAVPPLPSLLNNSGTPTCELPPATMPICVRMWWRKQSAPTCPSLA